MFWEKTQFLHFCKFRLTRANPGYPKLTWASQGSSKSNLPLCFFLYYKPENSICFSRFIHTLFKQLSSYFLLWLDISFLYLAYIKTFKKAFKFLNCRCSAFLKMSVCDLPNVLASGHKKLWWEKLVKKPLCAVSNVVSFAIWVQKYSLTLLQLGTKIKMTIYRNAMR